MKTNRIIKLCAISFACGLLLFGWTVRWIWLPTGHPVPIIVPKVAAAGTLYNVWQQTIVQPALKLWG